MGNIVDVPWEKPDIIRRFHRNVIETQLTYLLHAAVLLEKLTVSQPVKKFPTFYGTRRFITAFTSARHLSLSWASSIQSMPLHPTSWRSIILLSSHLWWVLPSRLFPLGLSLQNPVYPSPLPHTCYMPRPSHSRFYPPNNIGRAVQIIKFLTMYFSPLSCYLVPLRPKYSPQHPIPKHPQPTFFP